MKCLMCNCHGNVFQLVGKDRHSQLVYCDRCGLIYSQANGIPLFDDERNSLIYFNGGKIIDENGDPFEPKTTG